MSKMRSLPSRPRWCRIRSSEPGSLAFAGICGTFAAPTALFSIGGRVVIYLVRPNREMAYVKLPLDPTMVASLGLDPTQFDWHISDSSPADNETIALALRYGESCVLGILLDVKYVSIRNYARNMEKYFEKEMSRPNDANDNALVEAVFPGSNERARDINRRVKEDARRVSEGAVEDLRLALADRAPRSDLVVHWREMGGPVPDL